MWNAAVAIRGIVDAVPEAGQSSNNQLLVVIDSEEFNGRQLPRRASPHP
jgi:hypothetical protein